MTAAEPPSCSYRLLGPLEVCGGNGTSLRIPPGRQQTILSALLLDANRVVAMERLIDIVWGDEPPQTARTQIQICVSQLRGSLDSVGLAETILTKPPGYLLRVAQGQLDLGRFTTAVADAEAAVARGEDSEASQLLRTALALWQGPALSGTTSRLLQPAAAQLDEARFAALETCADIDLRLGRHRQLIGELGSLVSEHPLRERLRGQLMLALYRSGRQSEALEVYRTGRATLIDQLGLEPGDALRAVETAILSGEADLPTEPPAKPVPPVSPVPPSTETTESAESAAPPPPPPPQTPAPLQLPRDIADFTGRADLIEQTRGLLCDEQPSSTATRVVVLTGKSGAGKSTLAIHLAHQLAADHFPDGQLYRDLGATHTERATADDVLGRFLRALGIPGEAVPETLDERAEMYRQLLARKRMLVVLDDVADESQLKPLLPGSTSSAVIVTSRARLSGLAGAHGLEVDVLDTEQAVALLTHLVGEQRVAGERAAAEALVRMVGGLPLALRIVAARLSARPHWSLAWMLERLSDERRRLDELAHGQMMVRASLTMTYDGLPQDTRRLLRLLGLVDGSAFPTWAAAALLDTDLYEAGDLLEQLVDAQLLEISGIDLDGSPRYRFHDLIRLYAREQLDREESPAEQRGAVARIVGGWLGLAAQAHRRLYGGDFTVLHSDATRWLPPQRSVDALLAEPLMWLDAEHTNLCAAVGLAARNELPAPCWDLAVSLVALFEARCYFDDWERTHTTALEAVRAAGDRRGEAALLCSLGSLQLSRSRTEQAREYLLPALAAFQELGEVHGSALTERNLALVHHFQGEVGQAEVFYRSALSGFLRADDPVGQAHVLGQIGQLELVAGDEESAARRFHEALAICRATGGARVEVQLRYRLAELLIRRNEVEQGRSILIDLLERVRTGRDLTGEARIVHRIGLLEHRLGDFGSAYERLSEALRCRELMRDHGGCAEVRLDLAAVLVELDDREQALDHLDRARSAFQERDMSDGVRRTEELQDNLAGSSQRV